MNNTFILYLKSYYSSFAKKEKVITLLLVLLFINFSHFSFAQFQPTNGVEPCATDIIHQRKLAQDPQYRQDLEQMETELAEYIQNSTNQRREGNTIIIPLVVHIIHTGDAIGTIYNPTDARIVDMIAYLNQAFGNNAPFNTAGGLDTDIRFELAKRTENCTTTNGINRVDGSGVPNYTTGGVSIG